MNLPEFLELHGGRVMAQNLGVTFEEFIKAAELSDVINTMIMEGELKGTTAASHYIDALPVSSILKIHITFSIAAFNDMV